MENVHRVWYLSRQEEMEFGMYCVWQTYLPVADVKHDVSTVDQGTISVAFYTALVLVSRRRTVEPGRFLY